MAMCSSDLRVVRYDEPTPPRQAEARCTARQINALIVDDSLTTRKLVMQALSQTGLAKFVFTEANDGIDALGKYRPGETEIVFVDLNMPRMNGTNFIRTLRKQYKKCPPIVVITAETSRERLLEAIQEAEADAFMLKPLDGDRLRAGLQKILASIPTRSGPSVVPHGECVALAMQTVINKACNIDLSPTGANDTAVGGDIVLGIVSLRGDLEWTVVMGFTRDAAAGAASRFAGREMAGNDHDLGDAIGEITNMIGGRIRLLLSEKGLNVNASPTTVIAARDFQNLLQRKSTSDHVHFDSPVGKLWTVVSVGLNPGMML